MKLLIAISIFAAMFFLSVGPVFATDQEQIYGSQLMTEQERFEYREKIRNANTNEEREEIRKEHHEKMKERAKAQGKMFPDMPPSGGAHMGHDGDMGTMGGGGGGRR